MTVPQSAPPGWFVDPERPGYERRWDGDAWIGKPHKTPARSSLFGPAYDRAYWTNANPPARVARWSGLVGVLPMLALVPIAVGADAEIIGTVLFVLVIVAIPATIVTIVFGALGIARGRRAGAFALSVQVTVASSVLLVIYSFSVLIVTTITQIV